MQPNFEYLDYASVNRNYDWFSLNINVNFNADKIDLEKIVNRELIFGNTVDEIIFIHEYTHYLQNFNTPLGAVLLCQFTHALFQMGASKLNENIIFKLPLKLNSIDAKPLWNAGIEHINNIRTALGHSDDIVNFEGPATFEDYKIVKTKYLTISNGRAIFEITNKAIREHMAHLSSMLFVGYNDQQIHEDYLKRKEFYVTEGMLEKQPSYWILFEYFYFHKYTNVAEGLILLCMESMTCATPMTIIEAFFKNIQEPKFASIKNLHFFVKLWTGAASEIKRKNAFISDALKMIEEKIALCKKHKEHDFYKFNIALFEKLAYNIRNFEKLNHYFSDANKLRDKDSWVKIIREFGTPIVRYKSKSPLVTGQSNEVGNALTYFLGVVKTIDSLRSTTVERCPFHTDFPICTAGHKNDTTCLTDPVTVTNL